MLEVFTPGATLVVSACSCLLCVGLFWSFQVYFLPYLRQRRSSRPSLLPQTIQVAIDQELCHSLYEFPDLLRHCPRGSLALCELESSKWSTGVFATSSGLPSPARTLGNFARAPQQRIARRDPSANPSTLRQSLMSESSLAIPTEESCSTITDIGHADYAAPRPPQSHRKSMPSFSESSGGVSRNTTRRHSAPTLVLIRETLLLAEMLDTSSNEPSPTETTFSKGQERSKRSKKPVKAIDLLPPTSVSTAGVQSHVVRDLRVRNSQ